MYIDGKKVGQTPYGPTRIQAKDHRVRVVPKSLYDAWEEVVVVEEGKEKKVSARCKPHFATVSVSSEPRRAQVYLNDRLIGTTPIQEEKIEPGAYRLRIEDAEGKYEAYAIRFTVDVGDKETLSRKLVRKTGTLKILSDPEDVEVYVDEDLKGKAFQFVEGLTLPTGKHEVELRKERYVSHRKAVQIEDRQTDILKATLITHPEHILSQIDKWKRWKVVSLTTMLLSAAASGTCWILAEQNYKDYQDATSTEDADRLRENVERFHQLKIAMAVTAGVQLISYFYTSGKQSHYEKQRYSGASEKEYKRIAQRSSPSIAPTVRFSGGVAYVSLGIRF